MKTENRYKIILSNKNLYKEIEVPMDVQKLSIGTDVKCDIRLHKERFFDQFELVLKCQDGNWNLICSDNIYIYENSVSKNVFKNLNHGDEFTLRYCSSDNDIFRMSFMIDFEQENKDYDRCIDLGTNSSVTIGGSKNANIFLDSLYVQDDSIVIEKRDGKYYLKELKTLYGVSVNGIRISGQTELKNTDFFSIAEFSFYLKNNKLYTSQNAKININGLNTYIDSPSKGKFLYPHFNRKTRLRTSIPNDSIKILDPVAAPSKPEGNIFLQLTPAIIMLGVTIVFRLVLSSNTSTFVWVSLISMTMGIVTSTITIVSDRKKYAKETKERIEKYNEYIDTKTREIEELREDEKNLLKEIYLSEDDEINMVNDFSAELFNRKIDDPDFMELRLGLGCKEAVRKIEYKPRETYDGNDELAEIPAGIASKFANIDNVPITIKLRDKNAIGFVGSRDKLFGFLKNITIDLATRHYYKDIELFCIIDEEFQNQFKWIRFLPHLRNDALGMRNLVCDNDSKNILFEYLYKELTFRSSQKNNVEFKQIVVLVYNDLGLKRHPISRFINDAQKLNIVFMFFEEDEAYLPSLCDEVVYLNDDNNGMVVSAENSLNNYNFKYNEIDTTIAEKIATKLAPVYCDEVSLEGTLTKSITMFEMLNILNAEDINLEFNWNTSEVYKSLAAPLGVKAKGQVVYLDLNEKKHGPHGLVAGTTGSGKSEILQSYILSMAALFHPYEVGFVIIDFKGGGMVNQFKELPHLVGAITNIDGREIDRSLSSIKAELRKRQELFAQYNVNHVDSYIKLFKKGEAKIPLPHLILIVDEFAELKMDQPEFMKELISAARIGRSLGIHLILATQKPSGVVDAQIWSNSKFKLCLKVQNKEDSNEVLKTPLAAEIKEPGRAYLQVGNNEIFDLFQSAYSGGPAVVDDDTTVKKFSVNRLSLSGKKTVIFSQKPEKNRQESESQLDAIVAHIANYCNEKGIDRLPGICLPPLKELYTYGLAKACKKEAGSLLIPIGIYDDPDCQRQEQVNLELSGGNTFVLGSSQYGKTGMLQTIIRGIADNYSPEEANIYILDFASMALKAFSTLNHVGGVLVPGEDDKLKLFFKMMNKEVKGRKDTFSQIGITSFQSYKEAGYSDLPHIVILLDNITAFKELYDVYVDDLLNLCREGAAVGLTVCVTAQQMSGIGYKFLSTFANKYAYSCNDKSEFTTLFDRCRMDPKNVPGRGLTVIDKVMYEYQGFLAFDGEKEIDRVKAIKEFIELKNNTYTGMIARRIPEVPALLTAKYLTETFGKLKELEYYIGIDFENVEAVKINTSKDGFMAITGKDGSGRSNYVKYLFSCMQKEIFTKQVEAYIVDGFEQKLQSLKEYAFVEKYTTDSSEFELILDKVESVCQDRADKCKELGNAALNEEPLIVVVVNNSSIYENGNLTKEASAQLKNIIKTYKMMKVFFIFSGIENTSVSIGASEIQKFIKENKNILFFDELSNIKLTDVSSTIQRQYRMPPYPGDGFYIAGSNITRLRTPICEEE